MKHPTALGGLQVEEETVGGGGVFNLVVLVPRT